MMALHLQMQYMSYHWHNSCLDDKRTSPSIPSLHPYIPPFIHTLESATCLAASKYRQLQCGYYGLSLKRTQKKYKKSYATNQRVRRIRQNV